MTSKFNAKPLLDIILAALFCLFFLLGCSASDKVDDQIESEISQQAEAEKNLAREKENTEFTLNGRLRVAEGKDEDYKLRSAPVAALSKERFLEINENLNAALSDFSDRNKTRYQKYSARFEKLKEKSALVLKEYEKLYSNYEKLLESYKTRDSSGGSAVLVVPSLNIIKALDESANERVSSIHSEITKAINKVNAVVERYESIRAEASTAAKPMYKISSRAAGYMKTHRRNSMELFLSNAKIKTKTNVDSEFSLNLERGKNYTLVAYANANLAGDMEEYYWIVPFSAPLEVAEGEIVMTSENPSSDSSRQLNQSLDFKSPSEMPPLDKLTMQLILAKDD